MSAEFDALRANVAAQATVIDSVITLLNDLKARLDSALAANDTAALQQLADDIDANTRRLAEAVVANTPAA